MRPCRRVYKMQLINKYKYLIIFTIIYLTIILIPPILYPSKYLSINADGAGHLFAFSTINTGNQQFLYLGQQITGYLLMWISNLTNIRIDYLLDQLCRNYHYLQMCLHH